MTLTSHRIAARLFALSFLFIALHLIGATSAFAQGKNKAGVASDSTICWVQTRALPAAEAFQAAAADDEFVYAISSTLVAKYSRESGERIAVSRGEAKHLNGGFFWKGRLYCSHSNYPLKPEQSQVKVLDVGSMRLSTFKDFGDFGGSLTWVVRHEGHWWCNFAHYGADNSRTFLVQFDDDWRERGRWAYPAPVIRDLGQYSLSGGLWHGGDLLVTGHDDPVLYRLRLPEQGGVLEYLDRQDAPFTGQGIAHDPRTDGLVGINRSKRLVVFAAQDFPRGKLDSLAKSFVGRLGFYAKDLNSGATYAWHADDRYPPASVIKLPVMVELYRQAAAGKMDLDERRLLPQDISTHGTGDLKRREGPVELSLREYGRLMMVESDNMATDMVMRTVGMGTVNSFLDEQGLENTRVAMELGRWHYVIVGMTKAPISRGNDVHLVARMRAGKFDNKGLGYSDSLKNNVCGPRDMGVLLERLYLQQLAPKSSTAEMLDMMASSTHKQTIARYLRESVRVSNKYGGSQRIAADAGIVELPGRPIVIAGFALSDDSSTQAGRELLARMSRLIIATVDPDAVTAVE